MATRPNARPGNETAPRPRSSEKTRCHEAAIDLDVHPLAGSRPPEYVIVLWTTEQLRDRLQRNNAALAQELHDRGRHRHGRTVESDAEIEAEP